MNEEEKVIKGSIEGLIENYKLSINDNERVKTDNTTYDFIDNLDIGKYRKETMLRYYEINKKGE